MRRNLTENNQAVAKYDDRKCWWTKLFKYSQSSFRGVGHFLVFLSGLEYLYIVAFDHCFSNRVIFFCKGFVLEFLFVLSIYFLPNFLFIFSLSINVKSVRFIVLVKLLLCNRFKPVVSFLQCHVGITFISIFLHCFVHTWFDNLVLHVWGVQIIFSMSDLISCCDDTKSGIVPAAFRL